MGGVLLVVTSSCSTAACTYAWQVCLYVVDNLVPRFGDDLGVMPLGPRGTTELLLNASLLFERKGMDWQAGG